MTANETQSRLWHGARTTGAFLGYVLQRFLRDGCFAGAGALSYTTLVSLVPLTAVVMAVFSAFPIFSNEREEFLGLLAHYFIPEVGEEAGYWFKYFASVAAQTTAFGVIALAVTAVLLLTTIEDQLHSIWRVRTSRPWLQRVLAYWAVLTFGPLLIGMGLSLSSYLEAAAHSAGLDAVAFEPASALWLHRAALILPFLIEAIACTLVYKLIPSCTVRWREGLLGGIVAALAIELLKVGFSLYIGRFSSYRTIYGAVAAVPIFLLWMYVTWGAVLFGAVVAAAMPQWRIDFGEAGVTRRGRQLGLALAFLAELADAAQRGAFPASAELASSLGITVAAADDQLATLQEAGFAAQTTSGGWVLGRPLAGTTLFDLYRAMRLPLADDWRGGAAEAPWQRRVVGPMQRVIAAEAGAMRLSLAELLGVEASPAAPPRPIDLDSWRR